MGGNWGKRGNSTVYKNLETDTYHLLHRPGFPTAELSVPNPLLIDAGTSGGVSRPEVERGVKSGTDRYTYAERDCIVNQSIYSNISIQIV